MPNTTRVAPFPPCCPGVCHSKAAEDESDAIVAVAGRWGGDHTNGEGRSSRTCQSCTLPSSLATPTSTAEEGNEKEEVQDDDPRGGGGGGEAVGVRRVV